MKAWLAKRWTATALMGTLLSVALTGCQSNIGGQTLPSAYFLRDDVQYFPAGPEFKLTNQLQALEQYRLEQQRVGQGLAAEN